jgi:opacity protein-like surface antigen
MRPIAKRLLGAGVLGALGIGSAAAADIPVKAAPLPVVTVYNWTGVYIGAHVGYGKGRKEWGDGFNIFAYDVSGWLAGGQIGVNQQIGNWVFGIEADASWTNIDGGQNLLLGGPALGFEQTFTANTKIDSIVTVAGRIGFAQDRWLVYVKLGAAWLHESHSIAFSATTTIVGGPAIVQTAFANGSEDRFGPMLGIGSEFALWGNWSFKSEYNYIHLPTGSLTLAGTQTALGVTTPFAGTQNINQSIHLAKFGINYRFGPDTPPAIAPSRPAPGYNWTGAWVGVQAGYGFGRKVLPEFAEPLDRYNIDGWLAGVTTGANVQAGVFVLGVESEWLWARMDGGITQTQDFFGVVQRTDLASRVDWLSLNSVRIGFAGMDRWLFYVKGGVALAKESHSIGQLQDGGLLGNITSNFSGSALHTGYLAGIGVEYAFLGNWSAKLEYNYINIRLQDVVLSGVTAFNIPPALVGTIASSDRFTYRQDLHLVKFGINYHFNSFVDVISARY